MAAVLALTLAQPTVAPAALVLSNARTSYRTQVLLGLDNEIYTVFAPITLHIDEQDSLFGATRQSVAYIVTSFGNRPMADAQAHSSCTPGQYGWVPVVTTSAYASVHYQVGINQLGQIPVISPPTEVPVRVTVRGHASESAGASVHIEAVISRQTPPNFAETITISMPIGAPYDVGLDAAATARTGPDPRVLNSEEQAVADPLFEFDQDAFDASRDSLGLPTYTLADHYEIQFSPNILAGDLDEDGDVDFVDFSILARQWRQAPGEPSADIAPPGEPDGIVDFWDLAVFCAYWLESTNP